MSRDSLSGCSEKSCPLAIDSMVKRRTYTADLQEARPTLHDHGGRRIKKFAGDGKALITNHSAVLLLY